MLGSFFKLISGNAIQQVCVFLLVPLVTRLYPPDAYGLVAMLLGYTRILAVVATMRFDQAILITKTLGESHRLTYLCICLSVVFCLLIFCLVAFDSAFLGEYRVFGKFGLLAYALPLLVLILSLNNMVQSLLIKIDRYGLLAVSSTVSGVFVPLNRILLAYISTASAFNLILGYVAAFVFGAFFYIRTVLTSIRSIKIPSIPDFKSLLLQYKDFPLYGLPSAVMNRLAKNLPVLFFGYFDSFEVAAYYAIALRLIGLPIQVCTASFRRSIVTKISTLKSNGQPFFLPLLKYVGLLALIIMVPLGLLFLVGQFVFDTFLGDKWEGAGIYVSILVPYFLFDAMQNISSVSFLVLRRQRIQAILQLLGIIIVATSFIISFNMSFGSIATSGMFSAASCISSTLIIVMSLYQAYSWKSFQEKM